MNYSKFTIQYFRSFQNMQVLKFATDLGIKKAGVILNSGDDKSKIKLSLESAFPEYKIVQWNKNDIMDKKKYFNSPLIQPI